MNRLSVWGKIARKGKRTGGREAFSLFPLPTQLGQRPVHRLTRFLTMTEVAEVEDGVVIIECVAVVYEEGEGGEHYRNKNKFRCRVVNLKEKIW